MVLLSMHFGVIPSLHRRLKTETPGPLRKKNIWWLAGAWVNSIYIHHGYGGDLWRFYPHVCFCFSCCSIYIIMYIYIYFLPLWLPVDEIPISADFSPLFVGRSRCTSIYRRGSHQHQVEMGWRKETAELVAKCRKWYYDQTGRVKSRMYWHTLGGWPSNSYWKLHI